MDKEELKQLILEVLQEQSLSSLNVPFHKHTTTDAGQLEASKSLLNAPQPKLTTASGGSLSSAGTGLLPADKTILDNAITRITNIESTLTLIGLIKSS